MGIKLNKNNNISLKIKDRRAINLWVVEIDGVEHYLEAICGSHLNIPELVLYEAENKPLFQRD